MTNIVEVLLTVKDNASGKFKDVTKAASNIGKELAKIAAVGAAVFAGIVTAAKKATDAMIEQARATIDLSRALGLSSEEASTLIETADDFLISTEDLKTGLRTAINQGVNPTIDGLKALSKEYLAIKDPIDRTRFAMEKFGTRSGLEMQKLLEAGPEAFDKTAESAKKAGLVMSGEAIRAAESYRKKMDDVSDSLRGAYVNAGLATAALSEQSNLLGTLVGQLNEFSKTSYADFLASTYDAHRKLFSSTIELADGTQMDIDKFLAWGEAMQAQSDQHVATRDQIYSIRDAADDLAGSLDGLGKAQLLQRAAEALMAGDTATAQRLVDLAEQAGAYEERLQATIRALDELNGKKITAEFTLKMEQEFAGAAGRRPTEEGGGGAPSVPGGGGGGEGYHHRAWREQHPDGVDSEGRSNPYDYGYAYGGQFTVGGSGGGDNQLVQFRATPGERVTVTPRGQSIGGINVTIGTVNERSDLDNLLAYIRDRTRR